MSRTFAYARVSTIEQETQNQVAEIEAAGFKVEPHRIITETVSGSVSIALRIGFSVLLGKMEEGGQIVKRRCASSPERTLVVGAAFSDIERLLSRTLRSFLPKAHG